MVNGDFVLLIYIVYYRFSHFYGTYGYKTLWFETSKSDSLFNASTTLTPALVEIVVKRLSPCHFRKACSSKRFYVFLAASVDDFFLVSFIYL